MLDVRDTLMSNDLHVVLFDSHRMQKSLIMRTCAVV
jgi:hypothetical protein